MASRARGFFVPMTRYEPKEIEAKWQRVWEDEGSLPHPESTPAERGRRDSTGTSSRCCRTRRATACTWATSSTTRWATSSRTSAAATAGRCCARWAGTRSACRRRTRRSARAATRARSPSATSRRSATQMQRLGWAIDWDREVSSHEPDFYRWTQWLFLRFFERGLAYRKEAPVNWCPNDQTVIANEYVVDGQCERCGTPVELRNMTQWFFKMTAYADELLRVRAAARAAGGPSGRRRSSATGSAAARARRSSSASTSWTSTSPVFTTRPDTLFGATFFVVAPEHPFVEAHASEEAKAYARHAGARRTEDRAADEAKTGVFTGHYATNPVNGEQLPIYVADYVLMDYGTGAIMAVPGHDERDREFAEAFDLPIVEVIDEDGRLVNSGQFDGLPAEEAKARDRRMAARDGTRRAGGVLPPARLELLPAALLGLPDPDRLLRRLRRRPRARRRPARAAARRRGLPAEGQGAAGLQRGVDARPVPALRQAGARARPTRWTRSSTRPGTSCATSTRTTTRRRSTARSSTTGCRSTSTSAASTMRPATSCTRASSSRR